MDEIKEIDVHVPWHEQTILESTICECQRCQFATERYRAMDNVPKFAHLCRACWEEDIHKTHYIGVMRLPPTPPPTVGGPDLFGNLRCVGPELVLRGPARVTAASGLNVRAEPGLLGQYVRTLPYGSVVDVTGSNGRGWLQLSDGNWVCSTAPEGDVTRSLRDKYYPQPWVRPL